MGTNKDENNDARSDSAPPATRSYGITNPISTKHPEPSDYIATKNLEDTLRSYDYFESSEELSHRVEVLSKLNELVREWIYYVSVEKNIPPDVAKTVGGRVYTFGSYRLGVHSKGGDIDTLLIAPRHIDRSDFFTSFVEVLRRQREVRDLRAIEEAYVPVIKFTFDGIELDMLFARLALATVPENLDLKDDKILHNLDQRCARSLNGYRVTDEILDLVPDHETFKSTLRAIKLWAKKNGLYNNALGFFGGVTWAMLVARICQLYPNAVAATLLHKFFLVYSNWEWPTPVLLKPVADAHYGFPVWDPMTNPFDRYHLMPIITPAYPQQNSTHNVTKSTQKVIVQEIKRGLEIVTEIMASRADWKKLFTSIPYFDRYKHYIILLLSAPDQNQYLEWSGLVEAKIRILIANLERNPCIEIAHVSSERYTPDESIFENSSTTMKSPEDQHGARVNGHQSPESSTSSSSSAVQKSSTGPTDSKSSRSNFSTMWIVGLQFVNVNKVRLDLTEDIRSFVTVVKRAANNILYQENVDLDARYMRRRELRTVLPDHVLCTSNKRVLNEENSESNSPATHKRAKLNSTSSDSGINNDVNTESRTTTTTHAEEDMGESCGKTATPASEST